MKNMILLILVLASSGLFAQPNFSTIINDLKSANTTHISSYMDETVELAVGDTEGTYAKEQAVAMINAFFKQNKPNSCSLVHSGAAQDGTSYYGIGSLRAGDKKYRIYIFLKQQSNEYKIQEMRIELE